MYCLTSLSYVLFLKCAAFHGPFEVSGASRNTLGTPRSP